MAGRQAGSKHVVGSTYSAPPLTHSAQSPTQHYPRIRSVDADADICGVQHGNCEKNDQLIFNPPLPLPTFPLRFLCPILGLEQTRAARVPNRCDPKHPASPHYLPYTWCTSRSLEWQRQKIYTSLGLEKCIALPPLFPDCGWLCRVPAFASCCSPVCWLVCGWVGCPRCGHHRNSPQKTNSN